jgi:hypothetical protein
VATRGRVAVELGSRQAHRALDAPDLLLRMGRRHWLTAPLVVGVASCVLQAAFYNSSLTKLRRMR